MVRFGALLVLLFAWGIALGQAPVAQKLRPGDVLVVIVPDLATQPIETAVQDDGKIYLPRVGGVEVAGVTLAEAEVRVRAALSKVLRDPIVGLVLKEPRPRVVYVLGARGNQSPVPVFPGLDLRTILAQSQLPDDLDKLQVSVFRQGRTVAKVDPQRLFAGDADAWNGPLEPDDVVSVQPRDFVRIFVTGNVARPGQTRVDVGTTVQEAVAAAGGIVRTTTDRSLEDRDFDITVRRNGQILRVPAVPQQAADAVVVEPGDTLSVELGLLTVTVVGEVVEPGRQFVSRNATVLEAIAEARGTRSGASLTDAMLYRRGELIRINASTPVGARAVPPVTLERGDVVFVPVNERAFTVLGRATRPGRYPMLDNVRYRASDALAAAGGGLARFSTDRRMIIARFGDDGRLRLIQFNLDEFYRDGKESANPEILPGDTLFVAPNREFSLASASAVVAGFLSLDRIIRR